jgi:hypothetical protein
VIRPLLRARLFFPSHPIATTPAAAGLPAPTSWIKRADRERFGGVICVPTGS